MANLYNLLTKRGQLFAFLLGLIIALIFFGIVTAGSAEFEMLSEEDQEQSNLFNFGLYAAIYLVIINAVIALLFGVWFLIREPKRSIQMLIGLGIILVIWFITYSTADPGFSGPIASTLEEFDISEGVSKFVSAGLSTALILAALASISIIVAEIINLFKN